MPARSLRPVPDTPGRAVLYVRVSALMGRGGDDFHSPELQVANMRRAIATAGLREVAVVEDIDVSGQSFSRQGIDRIKEMVEARQIDALAVYDLSRLGRNLADALVFIRWLRERGVSVLSSHERIDDSPEGQFQLSLLLGLAELYGKQVGRRWSEVIEKRARQGHHHSTPPTGYRRDGKEMVPDPVFGPLVTEAFRAYAAGMPIGQIARRFADARGRHIHPHTVKRMLVNPVYRGRVALWTDHRTRGHRMTVPPALTVEGRHEPLVDADTWQHVQERIARDAKTAPRLLQPSHPLVGLAVCAHCQRHLQRRVDQRGTTRGGGFVPIDRLLCGASRVQGYVGPGVCDGIGMPPLDGVVDEVLDWLRARIKLLRDDSAARVEALGRRARAGADATRLEAELGRVRAEQAKLTAGWLSGRVPDSAYDTNIAELSAAEKELAARLADARMSSDQPPPAAAATATETLLRLWPDLDNAQKVRALRPVVKRVVVRRAREWREPLKGRVVVEWW
jgi:site-specific DNA recombinase